MPSKSEESRALVEKLAEAARLDWNLHDGWSIGPGYDGEPDLLVPTGSGSGSSLPSGRPCPCEGTGQFPDGLPCPVHGNPDESLGAGNACGEDPGVYPAYGNRGRGDGERGL